VRFTVSLSRSATLGSGSPTIETRTPTEPKQRKESIVETVKARLSERGQLAVKVALALALAGGVGAALAGPALADDDDDGGYRYDPGYCWCWDDEGWGDDASGDDWDDD
jgi:hypothetical protein